MFKSPFLIQDLISADCEIVFVSDNFVEDYIGGAELTSEALIQTSPFKIQKIHSHEITMGHLRTGVEKFWIFGNFSNLNPQLIPSIVGNLKYSILEYDYKFCRFRSPEKHLFETQKPCDCADQITGKLISTFYHGSKGMWWMSEKQKDIYFSHFPFLKENNNIVLSSVFDLLTLQTLKSLREKYASASKQKWIVLGSSSWIKGKEQAEKYCQDNHLEYEVLWNLPYHELLDKLAQAEGLVYLPNGSDTCPRLVIEAKLLNCKLVLNDYVQHKDEIWFNNCANEDIEEYLLGAPHLFWNGINNLKNYQPSIASYTTTYNCISQEYPFEQSIKSVLDFSQEVCILDGGSNDGTWEKLQEWARQESKLKLKQINRDWTANNAGLFDGENKAEARKMCASQNEFLYQFDGDEISFDGEKLKTLAQKLPQDIDLIALPVLEFWSSKEKIRVDINPWKWRLSRNKPYITHGIPKAHRAINENGQLYSLGSDGCDYIHAETLEPIPFISFYTKEAHETRLQALQGNQNALQSYSGWLNAVVEELPGVFHLSWLNIERKIRLYKQFWSQHWDRLFNKKLEDTKENNMFFDCPWSEVSDQMIKEKAQELEQTGGHIFHSKYNGGFTPWISIKKQMKE